jgi:putative GTP pyrophosphokinase
VVSRRTAATFLSRHELYERLRVQGLLQLERALADFGDRVYKVSGRVKSPYSFVTKAERRGIERPLAQMTDIVGLRVVCIFRSDLDVASGAIRRAFTVLNVEDKAETRRDDSVFEYEDIQFVVRLPKWRMFDPELTRLRFEIQLRTLAMDTWGTISHLVAYKNAPLPRALGHEFYATNAMLWLADRTFDAVHRHRAALQGTASSPSTDDDPLDSSTLAAYIAQRFPDRRPTSGSSGYDEVLLTGCVLTGARTIGDLRGLLDKGLERIAEHLERADSRAMPGRPESDTRMPAWWVVGEALRAASPIIREYHRVSAKWTHAQSRSEALARMPFSPATYEELVWKLDKRLKKESCDAVSLRITREILAEMGADIPSAVEWLESQGGHCDCEVLMNVDWSVGEYDDS